MKEGIVCSGGGSCFSLGSRGPRRQCSEHNSVRIIMITRIALLVWMAHATAHGSETAATTNADIYNATS